MRPPNSDALTVTLQVFLSSHFSMILYIGSAILIVFLDSLQLKIAVFILKYHYPIYRRNFKRCSPNAASATVYVQLISTLYTLQDMLHICWKCSTSGGFCCNYCFCCSLCCSSSSSGSSCYKSKILCSGCSDFLKIYLLWTQVYCLNKWIRCSSPSRFEIYSHCPYSIILCHQIFYKDTAFRLNFVLLLCLEIDKNSG